MIDFFPVELKSLSCIKVNKSIFLVRIDCSKPIDLSTLSCTGVFPIYPEKNQFGFNLTSEGMDSFKAKVKIS